LSHGFKKDTCLINLPTLARLVLMSQRKVQNTIIYLESRGLIKRIGSRLGGEKRGNYYQVLIPEDVPPSNPNIPPEDCDENETDCMASDATLAPRACPAPHATVAQGATIENDDDDLKNKSSSSKGERTEIGSMPVENHTCAAVPREKETADFLLVREAYEKATGNRWNQSDSEAYEQNRIGGVPAAQIVSVLDAVVRRTPTKINSFKYFVREIATPPDPRNRAWQKKRLEKIVHKIRDISVGRGGYLMADFVEDVKRSCAREGVVFENDLFNELVS
jgi:hypothetical protein